jgi:hypothetical protein
VRKASRERRALLDRGPSKERVLEREACQTIPLERDTRKLRRLPTKWRGSEKGMK